VGCEGYYTEKELEPGNVCPTHKKPVERVKEPSYFFRLKKYEKRLLELYEARPTFVAPPARMNEVVSFVRGGLEDLSVSRTTFRWGVPVPDDPDHVMYVWFDALANYWSAIRQPEQLRRFWPPDVHVVGKDILRFHAVYWPAFLMAAGFSDDELPRQVLAHGFLTFNGQKMSKSLRNTVRPVALAETFGVDSVRYYLMRAIAFGQDGDFSLADLVQRFNAELGNTLGNLLNRVLHPCVKLTGSRFPAAGEPSELETALMSELDQTSAAVAAAFEAVAPHRALDAIFALLGSTNQYVDRAAPWAAAKKGDAARAATILATSLLVVQAVAALLWPVMPGVADAIRGQLGLPPLEPAPGTDLWPVHAPRREPGEVLGQPLPLFPRIDKEREAELVRGLGLEQAAGATASGTPATEATAATATAIEPQPAAAEPPRHASVEDFARIELRVATILSADRIKGKDKLLALTIDIGEPAPRPLVAGIAQSYAPEQLVGKRIVVVANLEPRKFGKGLVSHGMLLAAKIEGQLTLVTTDAEIAAGAKVN
jgi:methionyl-tRNA synthetase